MTADECLVHPWIKVRCINLYTVIYIYMYGMTIYGMTYIWHNYLSFYLLIRIITVTFSHIHFSFSLSIELK